MIQKNILNPMATMMIDGSIKDGSAVKVDVKNDDLVLIPSSPSPSSPSSPPSLPPTNSSSSVSE